MNLYTQSGNKESISNSERQLLQQGQGAAHKNFNLFVRFKYANVTSA